jgi:hypothetical protein
VRRKTPAELKRAQIAKVVRNHIRLKHSVLADEEINETLPKVLAQYDRALMTGQAFDLDTNELP